MRSAVVAELRQAIEDTVQGNLDKSNSKLFGMGYTSVRETSIDGPRCILGIRYFLKKALARLKIEAREAFSGEVIAWGKSSLGRN